MKKKAHTGEHRTIAANLHLKRNTKGTSNELSLSVLGGLSAQKDEEDASQGGSGTSPSFTMPHVFSGKSKRAPGASSKKQPITGADVAGIALSISDRRNRSTQARDRALANPEAEIKRRKTARRAWRAVGLAFALAAFAGASAFAVHVFTAAYEDNQQHKSLLSQGFSELTSADEVVLAADELVVASFNDLDESKIPDVLGKIPDVDVKLSAAKSFAESAKEGVSGDDEKAADQLAASAEARKTMLELAETILTEEQAAKQASNLMASCWENVLSADALLREAAELVTDTNEENTRASQKKCEQARELLTQASSQFEQAQALYPADYGPFDDYIAARQQSIAYAIASDEAIYVQDKATADSNNEKYNECDAAAAALAAKLPKTTEAPIVAALDESLGDSRQQYMEIRSQAAACDAFLRDYLGIGG